MRLLPIGLVLGLLVSASACNSTERSTPTTTPSSATTLDETTSTTSPSVSDPTTTGPTSTPSASTTTSTTTQPAVTPTTIATTTTTVAPQPTMVDVKVYFLREERLVIAHREVAGPEVLRGAVTELLAGPTADELDEGLFSVIPSGTELLGLNLAEGVATVDLNSEFESGGGTLSMTARIAQIVFTATQFENSDRVLFWLDGEPIQFLGGEGIILDEPQARLDVDRAFTGGVIIDAPTPGATVTSPFTVTGEGDVFEGQFPIEVWADGLQIGGVAPVTAGAWGEWADFEATIILDAPAGPIELIAYDEGGCGTDPECPEIIKTVVPLSLAP